MINRKKFCKSGPKPKDVEVSKADRSWSQSRSILFWMVQSQSHSPSQDQPFRRLGPKVFGLDFDLEAKNFRLR